MRHNKGGRKRGTANVRTREMIEELIKECGLLPAQVMLENMRYAYEMALEIGKKKYKTKNEKATQKMEERLYRMMAQECAKDCAPYIHPRLNTIELGNDPDNPISRPDVRITFVQPDDRVKNTGSVPGTVSPGAI